MYVIALNDVLCLFMVFGRFSLSQITFWSTFSNYFESFSTILWVVQYSLPLAFVIKTQVTGSCGYYFESNSKFLVNDGWECTLLKLAAWNIGCEEEDMQIITGKWAWLSCLFVTFKCHQGGLWLPVPAAYIDLLFACVR